MDYDFVNQTYSVEDYLMGSVTSYSDPLTFIQEKAKDVKRKQEKATIAKQAPASDAASILRAYGIVSKKETTQNPMGAGSFSFNPLAKKKRTSKSKK